MKIIQVIDLDGTTVKVDETNPSEPKNVAALQFDAGPRANDAIGDIAELVFAKPINANVEAVCVGYKGTDGKYYGKYYGATGGLEESLFEPKVQPQPPVTEEHRGFIELTIPADYTGNPELRIRPQDGKGESNYSLNELYRGADLNNGIYATLGDNNVYHFTHVAVDGEGVHTLRADKVYREPLGASMPVQFGTSADAMDRSVSLAKTGQSDSLDYDGGTFRVGTQQGLHINSVLTYLDHL